MQRGDQYKSQSHPALTQRAVLGDGSDAVWDSGRRVSAAPVPARMSSAGQRSQHAEQERDLERALRDVLSPAQ